VLETSAGFPEGEGLDVREARLGAWRGLEKQDRGEADSRALWGGTTGCWRVFSVFMLRSFIPNIEVCYVNCESRYYRVACVFLPRTLASLGSQGRYGRSSMIPSKLIFRSGSFPIACLLAGQVSLSIPPCNCVLTLGCSSEGSAGMWMRKEEASRFAKN
jgi:hypothetical protein